MRSRRGLTLSDMSELRVGQEAPALQLTACPECGLPTEITRRQVLASTDGMIEHVGLRCLARHVFLMPTSGLDRRSGW